MGALSSSSSPLILRCIFRRPPPPPATTLLPKFLPKNPSPISLQNSPIPISHTLSLSSSRSLSLSSSTPTHSLSSSLLNPEKTQTQNPLVLEEESEIESGSDGDLEMEQKDEGFEKNPNPLDDKMLNVHKELLVKLKSMSVKEKKELGSYAHSLGKKLKSQQVGKSGVTDSVATALVETLEANELLKLKIHNNCPGELDDVVSHLEEATGSVVVARIGRTVIIYRPSLTKLKAEEKKKQNQKLFLKRRAAFKSSFQNRGQSSVQSGRSRRVIRRP